MMHPDARIQYINDEIGYGIFATRFIPKGTIVWAFDKLDRVYSPAEFHEMKNPYRDLLDKYCYRDPEGNFVLCWDLSKYVNHSFHSNLISTPYNFELAIRDIQAGEQITDDYGYLNLTEPMEVAAEPGTDRKIVYPDDLLYYHKEWDEKIKQAFLRLDKVTQPLFDFLSPETQQLSFEIAKGNREPDSILNCFYEGNTRR